MAIVGFLAHAEKGKNTQVETELKRMSGITTYGIHKDDYIVAVAETKSDGLEKLFSSIHELDGVLATYVTSLTTEDEQL